VVKLAEKSAGFSIFKINLFLSDKNLTAKEAKAIIKVKIFLI
jgi:hypothetical protein